MCGMIFFFKSTLFLFTGRKQTAKCLLWFVEFFFLIFDYLKAKKKRSN